MKARSLAGIRQAILRLMDGRLQPYSLTEALSAFAPQRLLRDRDGGVWVRTYRIWPRAHLRGKGRCFFRSRWTVRWLRHQAFEDREGNI